MPQTATIFVIARPPGGGMPYAVVKRPALMVPFTVTVDDLVSMSEQRKLSMADEFEVVVRLSKSGTAMAEDGDWQWLSDTMDLSAVQSTKITANLSPPKPNP
jgi:cytochrome c-type biogenesis protein CcmH